MNNDGAVCRATADHPVYYLWRRTFTVISPTAEVRTHLEYLRVFHRRRRRPSPNGKSPREALADRAEFTQSYATDIVACRGCRFVFRNPHPTTQAITQAYVQDQYSTPRLAALFDAQLELYRPKAPTLRHWLLAECRARVVEVGSFVGGFLAAGQELGWELLGIDPGEEVTIFCRQQGLQVFQGTLAEAVSTEIRSLPSLLMSLAIVRFAYPRVDIWMTWVTLGKSEKSARSYGWSEYVVAELISRIGS